MHLYTNPSTQHVVALTAGGRFERELPEASARVGRGPLVWGRVEEIGSPAYWAAQSWMWELEEPEHYRLGKSLEEEVIACLLGGYGIPAEVGLAAYDRFRSVLSDDPASLCAFDVTYELLSRPLQMGGRSVKYRFARQKAQYVAAAMSALPTIDRTASDKDLRDALMTLPGIGPKTASWIVRNWRGSDEVSILDIHILRAGRDLEIFPRHWSVERHYGKLEQAYLDFANAIEARASILDSVMWMTMRALPHALTRPSQSH